MENIPKGENSTWFTIAEDLSVKTELLIVRYDRFMSDLVWLWAGFEWLNRHLDEIVVTLNRRLDALGVNLDTLKTEGREE
ncbi:hypothetical protein AMTR_s00028p00057630 [Amborella trichopoda]|uniref:Uncharacterized protein n=1 Tax=Amborella trichopoda TaxID=13333 RepID=W1PKM2_AMBTC|nr:hypothetical protein AMTR_s00028p00057630 [Amborella trichopoda]